MNLDGRNYVPTLAVRAAEMRGLEHLPAATKDRLLPCILLAPWATSASLGKAIERIERAFPDRSYFLDLDFDYFPTNLNATAQREFVELLSPERSHKAWVDFVSGYPHAWPCLQLVAASEADILAQVDAFQRMGRPYCLRIAIDRVPPNLDAIVAALADQGFADYAIVLEGGWTPDVLSLMAWFSGLVLGPLQRINADVPIVLSCTSMPKEFSDIEGIDRVPFRNRALVAQIAARSNRLNVTYGDWASTRPRERRGGGKPIPRIDYPTADAWVIARDKEAGWDYRKSAEELIRRSGVWNGSLGVWGEEMISRTAINPALGIDTPQKNVASRINIHLHMQAFFGGAMPPASDFDEDYRD